MAKKKANHLVHLPETKTESSKLPDYPPYDLNKRQANMLSNSIEEAVTFLEQLHATLGDRRQRMKLSANELAIVSTILAKFGPEQGWTRTEVDHLSEELTDGAGASGDGKDIGTVPH